MRPEVIGALVDGAIPFFGGIYATLLGFRVLGKKPGVSPKYDEWHRRFGGLMKILGPLLVLFGLFLWISGIARIPDSSGPSPGADWKRYATSDGVCSAEFPEQPQQETQSTLGIEFNRLTHAPSEPDIYYTLSFSDIPAGSPQATDEERLDAIRDSMPASGAQMGMKYRFIHEERISENGVTGRDVEFAAGEKHMFRAKVFILGTRIYRIIGVAPRSQKEQEDARRFLSSFRFEKSKK